MAITNAQQYKQILQKEREEKAFGGLMGIDGRKAYVGGSYSGKDPKGGNQGAGKYQGGSGVAGSAESKGMGGEGGYNRDTKKVDYGLDRLIISIDGLTQKTYEQYRVNGKLSKVLKASKYLVEAKKERGSATPHLIFQFLAVKPNEHEIPQVFELASEMSIDEVRIKHFG